MTTGKPDFNLNSFGIKYLSKDEVQEFLEKKINAAGNYEYEPPTGADQTALATERDKKGTGFKTSESANALQTPVTPKVAEKPATPTSSTISAPNAVGNKKLEGGTRSQFMSKEPPNPKMSNRETSLRRDIESTPETKLGDRGHNVPTGKNRKVDTSGIVTQRQRSQPQTKPDEGKAPEFAPKEHVGSFVDGGKVQGMSSTGKKRSISDSAVKKDPKERQASSTTGKKGVNQLPTHVGDAPKGVKSEKELIGGRNTQVGVGEEAHKKFKENPQGELTDSQKPKEDKPDGRKVDLNTQHRSSKGVSAHNKRGKDNSKWYNEEQRAAYKKIDSKDRNAQAKFHDEQDKKYDKSVDTPKKLSSAGQAIKDKLKKSNDIILDMNILKLDLNKISTFKPKMNKRGGRILNPNSDDDRSFGEIRAQEEVRVQNEKDKLSKSASETIFKAISLKLDLMKTDYSSPTDIDMKDVYEKKRVKEVEAKHNTSCPHCKQTLPKYQPDSYDE